MCAPRNTHADLETCGHLPAPVRFVPPGHAPPLRELRRLCPECDFGAAWAAEDAAARAGDAPVSPPIPILAGTAARGRQVASDERKLLLLVGDLSGPRRACLARLNASHPAFVARVELVSRTHGAALSRLLAARSLALNLHKGCGERRWGCDGLAAAQCTVPLEFFRLATLLDHGLTVISEPVHPRDAAEAQGLVSFARSVEDLPRALGGAEAASSKSSIRARYRHRFAARSLLERSGAAGVLCKAPNRH